MQSATLRYEVGNIEVTKHTQPQERTPLRIERKGLEYVFECPHEGNIADHMNKRGGRLITPTQSSSGSFRKNETTKKNARDARGRVPSYR